MKQIPLTFNHDYTAVIGWVTMSDDAFDLLFEQQTEFHIGYTSKKSLNRGEIMTVGQLLSFDISPKPAVGKDGVGDSSED